MNPRYLLVIAILFCINIPILSQVKLLEDFENIDDWKIYKSEGVDASIKIIDGKNGNAIRYEYNFTKGAGYGGIQKLISLDIPENFQFTFFLKASSPNNNFEIKFLDESGENVWWMNNRNFEFPTEWTKFTVKKRHISFAWGPIADKSFKHISRIEFTIASFNGGKGWIEIDDLQFLKLPDFSNIQSEPVLSASSEMSGYRIVNIFDKNSETRWISKTSFNEEVKIDFQTHQELGGVFILWDELNLPEKFSLDVSENNIEWERVYSKENNKFSKSFISLKDIESRYLRINLANSNSKAFGICEIKFLNASETENRNRFLINIAKEFPRGYYPRYLHEEKSYWNIIGVSGDTKEALINEDGMIEVDKARFSIEPFLMFDEKIITWNDVKLSQSLEDNYLPIPIVKWEKDNIELEVKSFAWGEANKSSVLYAVYKVKNRSSKIRNGKLFLTMRPFQVNPYYQWLNLEGGVSKISKININENYIQIDDDKFIYPLAKWNDAGAMSFEDGDLVSFLTDNKIPDAKNVSDKNKFASAVISYELSIEPNDSQEVALAIPFYGNNLGEIKINNSYENASLVNHVFEAAKKYWIDKLNNVNITLAKSGEKLLDVYRSNLAYILINRDRAGIQPGSRSYERSWIRDGALTSSALLKFGIVDEVREFIDWYSQNLFENGKVPCVVDTRGPDPVPENDSHGEYIFLIKQYYNFTKDKDFLLKHNDNVLKVVDYIKYLIDQRSTEHFKNGNDSVRSLYGLLPESISHEGYSAKPMHSYWDDFFALRGLKDAVEIQKILGNKSEYVRIKDIKDKFSTDLYNSIRLTIKNKNIDYIPGAAELGDFDATSTTIALYPVNELNNIPQPFLNNTFEKYYDFFKKRKNDLINWENFTPYEVRIIGSFVFLDEPKIAHELLDFFLKYQRPKSEAGGWNHWAEVVWKNERQPSFIGDMPHTWVGSDFINAFRAMFVYEDENDSSLVLAAAINDEWIDSEKGLSVKNMPTYYGEISYLIKKEKNKYLFSIDGNISVPKNGIKLKNFINSSLPIKVYLNGNIITDFCDEEIVVKEVPANIEIYY